MSWRTRLMAAGVLLTSLTASAHRLSPAYFGLNETAPDHYAAEWKVSIPGGLADVLEPQIPEGCAVTGSVRRYLVEDARLMHAEIDCDGGIAGKEFTIAGLAATDTDVLLRIGYLDGTSFTHRLVPSAPTIVVPAQPGVAEVVTTYLALGIEHILLGIDHLLFVLALVLLVDGLGRLVATITAFTVAHSVTLAAATLGFVRVAPAAVEATIALSIVFLAVELARRHMPGAREEDGLDSLTRRYPWVVAFTFGLLHGFGFAGALAEIGLPVNAIPLALLFFNLGVETGQLVFVAFVVGSLWLAHRLHARAPQWMPRVAAYAIGIIAANWLFERTLPLI
jgi:HupE / UreJ protein